MSDSLLSKSAEFAAFEYEAAACIVKTENKVLMIRHRLSGKLDFPGGGRSNSENSALSAACTAHRETWEETGFNVEVQQFLGTTKSGLLLFGCNLEAGLNTLPDVFDAPPWARLEVMSLEKIDPFLIDHKVLRFSDDLVPLRDGYIAFKDKP